MVRNHQDILDDIYKGNNSYKRRKHFQEDDDWIEEEFIEIEEFDERDDEYKLPPAHCREQHHTHEYLGSVKIAEREEDPHNHRFAGVTGQAIKLKHGSHFHKLAGNTDFFEDHFHIVADRTSPAIYVGDGRHVHFVEGHTTVSDGHRHRFIFATLIDNPIGKHDRD